MVAGAGYRMLAGDLSAPRTDLQHATETAARTGRPDVLAELHQGFGDVAHHQGDLTEAARRYEVALAAVGGGEDARREGRPCAPWPGSLHPSTVPNGEALSRDEALGVVKG